LDSEEIEPWYIVDVLKKLAVAMQRYSGYSYQ
jgi:hypothetical protein